MKDKKYRYSYSDVNDAKAMVAALELIFTSSARYGVSAADLSSELQQLGLPREHSTAVARLHTENCSQITAVLSSQSLRGDWSKFYSFVKSEKFEKCELASALNLEIKKNLSLIYTFFSAILYCYIFKHIW